MMNIDQLANEAKLLGDLANSNLDSLKGTCMEKNEIPDYYLGILRRQAILLIDLERLLNNRNPELITTPFIVLRSLMDDFLHILYLELHANKEEEIIKINASSYKQSFRSIEDLTNSNYNHFDGQYVEYLTNEQFQALKDTFVSKAENDRYFTDKENFRFKTFIPLSSVAESITHTQYVEIFKDRAFYLWKEFSSFVHYSNFSFYLEMNADPLNIYKIEEGFQYCYNTIYLAFKFFERNMNIDFKDNEELRERHGRIYEC